MERKRIIYLVTSISTILLSLTGLGLFLGGGFNSSRVEVGKTYFPNKPTHLYEKRKYYAVGVFNYKFNTNHYNDRINSGISKNKTLLEFSYFGKLKINDLYKEQHGTSYRVNKYHGGSYNVAKQLIKDSKLDYKYTELFSDESFGLNKENVVKVCSDLVKSGDMFIAGITLLSIFMIPAIVSTVFFIKGIGFSETYYWFLSIVNKLSRNDKKSKKTDSKNNIESKSDDIKE